MDPFSEFFPFAVGKVEAMVFRVPIAQAVETSFGIMRDRPALLVRVEDRDGAFGWGEVWCNFPTVGAEHRARVVENCVAPLLLGRSWDHPAQAFEELTRRLRILGIQCGEPGTMAQTIAGIDIALWDLTARRLGKPLWKVLGGSTNQVSGYASGINPTQPEKLAALKFEEGFRAFKLKVGFGPERDEANLTALRRLLGPDIPLMIDANQAWTPDDVEAMTHGLIVQKPIWLEEPIAADFPLADWERVAKNCPIPLAAGENIRGVEGFAAAIESGALAVIQSDLGKWGGFSGCLRVGRMATAHGKMFCPHWLGGGIGLAASMHLKAAVGAPGYVEVDANDNPLREQAMKDFPKIKDGVFTLSELPGLGVTPCLKTLRPFLVKHN